MKLIILASLMILSQSVFSSENCNVKLGKIWIERTSSFEKKIVKTLESKGYNVIENASLLLHIYPPIVGEFSCTTMVDLYDNETRWSSTTQTANGLVLGDGVCRRAIIKAVSALPDCTND